MWSASTVLHHRLVAKGTEGQLKVCLKDAENTLDATRNSKEIHRSLRIIMILRRESNRLKQGKVDLGG